MTIDQIRISSDHPKRGQVGVFKVSFRTYDPEREGRPLSQQYLENQFRVRGWDGNVTEIGRRLGIKTRDKRISVFSSRGRVIEEYLHRLARKYAGSLARGERVVDESYLAESVRMVG